MEWIRGSQEDLRSRNRSRSISPSTPYQEGLAFDHDQVTSPSEEIDHHPSARQMSCSAHTTLGPGTPNNENDHLQSPTQIEIAQNGTRHQLFPTTRTLIPISSIRHRRESSGQKIPQLELNQQAITPSLWVDENIRRRFLSDPRKRLEVDMDNSGSSRRMEGVLKKSFVISQSPAGQLEESSVHGGWASAAEERMISVATIESDHSLRRIL